MPLFNEDTIAAVATPPGEGGVAVIRVSGADALKAAQAVFRPKRAKGLRKRLFTYGTVVNKAGEVIDEAMAVYLPGPYTYTREDVCEIQCHGGHGAPQAVLECLFETGLCRPAEPGEFTKRAFLSGRIDLSEAEAVMDVIHASSLSSSRAAARQLEGGISVFVRSIRAQLEELLSLVCAATDFPDEIDEDVTARQVLSRAEEIRLELMARSDRKAAHAMNEGISVVLAGRPNVGKSSLLNAVAGYDRAIVSDIPGTTRDVLTESISYGGCRFLFSDTAGQRISDEMIESIGVDRAKKAMEKADVILLVLDGAEDLREEDRALLSNRDDRYLVVINKSDRPQKLVLPKTTAAVINVSASNGMGIGDLLEKILSMCGAEDLNADNMTRERQIVLAQKAASCLSRLQDTIRSGAPLDLVTDDIWQAMYALSEITGENASEDVIDAVFRNFCVGK